MIYLFSDAGLSALRRFINSSTLCAFDLDGTLAPIVPEPDGVLVPEDIRTGLIRLNGIVPVAVITGRARSDAQKHLGFPPRFIIGNHGAEGLPGLEQQEKPFYDQCLAWQRQLENLLPDAAYRGILIENKGASLALHYRKAADRGGAIRKIMEIIDKLEPSPRRISGKYVENILPRGALNKGDAVLRLMHHAGCLRAIFVGDDVTDEDVFRLADGRIFGIHVGCEGISAAGHCLSDQRELAALLHEMIRLIASSGDADNEKNRA
ncbi:MAG: trehalose-phosphatase [Deltaproteobacteria bacterium]|nr:trehalose-phosphatase [Deltaproteobacteria bacterium]